MSKCIGKVKYKNEADAFAIAARTIRKSKTGQYRVYKCDRCGGYHITSQSMKTYKQRLGD